LGKKLEQESTQDEAETELFQLIEELTLKMQNLGLKDTEIHEKIATLQPIQDNPKLKKSAGFPATLFGMPEALRKRTAQFLPLKEIVRLGSVSKTAKKEMWKYFLHNNAAVQELLKKAKGKMKDIPEHFKAILQKVGHTITSISLSDKNIGFANSTLLAADELTENLTQYLRSFFQSFIILIYLILKLLMNMYSIFKIFHILLNYDFNIVKGLLTKGLQF